MLTTNQLTYRNFGILGLMALMATTRFHHFGSAISLPDASLAVFFLSGLWFGGRKLFVLLLLEAGLIDYLAITQFDVSDFCISSAYIFLIPTYFTMWLAGKFCAPKEILKISTLVKQFGVLVLATSITFLISNGSFFLFSGRYTELSLSMYLERSAVYFQPYLFSTIAYVVLIYTLVTLVRVLKVTTKPNLSKKEVL